MSAALIAGVFCRKTSGRRRQQYFALSDRDLDAAHIAIPALLATSAVHHYLTREGLRTKVGLVVETGEAREVHHFALLAGYGAEAINPYLAFDTLSALCQELQLSEYEAHKHYIKAVYKGLLKVMSKMGISTYQSYCGAQIFNAIGLSKPFLDHYFTGTTSTTEGVGLGEVAEETVRSHRIAFGDAPLYTVMRSMWAANMPIGYAAKRTLGLPLPSAVTTRHPQQQP
jgi:glutamate synthase (NADPH) large chain